LTGVGCVSCRYTDLAVFDLGVVRGRNVATYGSTLIELAAKGNDYGRSRSVVVTYVTAMTLRL